MGLIETSSTVEKNGAGFSRKVDCFECRMTGTLGAFAIGSYLLYNSWPSNVKRTSSHRWTLRGLALGAFYISASRFFYLPPFTALKERNLQYMLEQSSMKTEEKEKEHNTSNNEEMGSTAF